MYAMYTSLEATGIWVARFVKRQLECMTENGCLDATPGLLRSVSWVLTTDWAIWKVIPNA